MAEFRKALAAFQSQTPNDLQMTRTRMILASSEIARQEALARFICCTAQMGIELRKLLDHRRDGQPGLDDCIGYIEERIRDFYRECFGTELD